MAKYTISDDEIIDVLRRTGHLDMPFGELQEVPDGVLVLNMPAVKRAIMSYQEFNCVPLEGLIAKHHPQRISAAVHLDGEVGPAMREMFAMPRCGAPDYSIGPQRVIGSGNWKGCWGVGDYHCAVVSLKNSPPLFLAPHWDEVTKRVTDMYAEMGCLFLWEQMSDRTNITVEFTRGSGWIGLAIMGYGQSCGNTIWAKFEQNYNPRNTVGEWTSLVAHELGHNSGLDHSRGGIMNPSIINGLPPTWRNDPSESLLKSRFGGKPVPRDDDPGERVMVVGYRYPDGKFEELYELPKGDGFWPGG